MWVYVPSPSSRSAREPACSMLEFKQACAHWGENRILYVTASGRATPKPLSWPGFKTRSWVTRLSGLRLTTSQATSSVRTWLAAWSSLDSPALPSVVPGSDSALTTSDGFGRKSCASRMTPEQNGCSSKTSAAFCRLRGSLWTLDQGSLFTNSSEAYCETWPTEGGMLSGVCFLRPRLERATGESVFSYWQTARTSTGGYTRDGGMKG